MFPDYVPENPYLFRKYTEKILPEIKTALKTPKLAEIDPGTLLRRIGRVQNLRRLEVLRKHQERAYKGRMQAIRTKGESTAPEVSRFRSEESLLSSEVMKILPSNYYKLIAKRSRYETEPSTSIVIPE